MDNLDGATTKSHGDLHQDLDERADIDSMTRLRSARRIRDDAHSMQWLGWVEPATPIFLAIHGAALLGDPSTAPIQWILVSVSAVLGVAGVAGWRSANAVRVRAWALVAITWLLLFVSGGVAAFFTLWYFMLSAVYPLVLRGRSAFAYPLTIAAAYLSLAPISETALAPAVLYGRTAVITAIGLVVAGISAGQHHASEALLKAKDEFVASISHELRTPLTAVVGFAAEMNEHLDDLTPEDEREYANAVHKHALEVANIVEDLLVSARVNGGTISVLAARVDLRSEIERIAGELTPIYGLGTGWFQITGPDVVVSADATRIRQIVRNLLVNAVKYGGPNLEARLSSELDSGVVDILDDGPGIAEHQLERLFRPYQQFHDEIGRPDSIGLGLSVSLSLAELMDGRLTYHRHEDRTMFRLELPLAVAIPDLQTNHTG